MILIVWQRYWPDVRIANYPSLLLCFSASVIVMFYLMKAKSGQITDPVKFVNWLLLVIRVPPLPDKLSAEDRSFTMYGHFRQ